MKLPTISIALLFTALLSVACGNWDTADSFAPNESGPNTKESVFVRVDSGSSDALIQGLSALATKSGTLSFHKFRALPDYVAVKGTKAEIESLSKNPNVIEVLEDPPRFLSTEKSLRGSQNVDPMSHQSVDYGVELIRALEAHHFGHCGQGIKVCVIDSGIDIAHPDIDSTKFSGGGPYDWDKDDIGHGTHVAGIVAALNNNFGTLGAAYDVSIIIQRVFDEYGTTSSEIVMEAAEECVDAGAQIINLSLGGPGYNAAEEAFYRSIREDYGVLVIAAGGNYGGTWYNYPASYDKVLGVAAVDRNKDVADFSQKNDKIDIAAPGVEVLSLLPTTGPCYGCDSQRGYGIFNGTSMASPYVAATAAAIWSAVPAVDASRIEVALLSTAEDLGTPGRDNSYGHGLVNMCGAIQSFLGDNGGACGMCLKLIESDECPADPDIPIRCTPDQVAVGELCEADGDECGTVSDADNCGLYDVYKRIPCAGDNDGECGMCLELVESDECPADPDLPTRCKPNEVAVGELCEADGDECGTDNSADNCGVGRYDVYKRIPCEAPICPCASGDNGGECGMCLKLVDSDECPAEPNIPIKCTPDQVAVGELCEADGDECGTDNDADNCGLYDVYKRIPCVGDNGGACGMCLKLVESDECPADPDLPTRCRPNEVAVGEMCEADGYECGTDNTVDNCSRGYDVYKRIPCEAPICPCASGDNGGECGMCLKLVESDECPAEPGKLPRCTLGRISVGESCEGDGECGTDNDANNCGSFDVYKRVPCVGDNGGECGMCLKLVESDECPADPDLATRCVPNEVAVGKLCEADGDECGTDNNADNCGIDGYDVYKRIPCEALPYFG